MVAVSVAVFTVFLGRPPAFADGPVDESWAKINKVRLGIRQVKHDHDEKVWKVNAECDGKIEAARKDFHNARARYLEEKKERLADVDRAYKDTVRPMEAEEQALLQSVAPAQNNFAKTREK